MYIKCGQEDALRGAWQGRTLSRVGGHSLGRGTGLGKRSGKTKRTCGVILGFQHPHGVRAASCKGRDGSCHIGDCLNTREVFKQVNI